MTVKYSEAPRGSVKMTKSEDSPGAKEVAKLRNQVSSPSEEDFMDSQANR